MENYFVKKKEIIFLFLIISVFEPDIFKSFSITDQFFLILKMITAVITVCEYIKISKRPRFGWIIICYVAVLFLSTFLNHQSLVFCFQKTAECMIIVMLMEIGLKWMGIKCVFLIYRYFYFLMVVQAALCVLYPNGLLSSSADSENYKMYFLGIKNGFIGWAVLLFTCGFLVYFNDPQNKLKKQLIFQFFITSLILMFLRSSTGIITWSLYSLGIWGLLLNKKTKNINFYKIFPALVIAYFAIVIFKIHFLFQNIIKLVFHKSASLTGRTITWDMAIRFIKQKPLYGYGIRETEVIQTNLGRGYSAHNFFLYLLLCGGVIAFTVLAVMFFCLLKKSYLYRNDILQKTMSLSLVAFFWATLTEAGIYNVKWFALFALFGNIDSIIKEKKSKSFKATNSQVQERMHGQ